MMSFPMLKKEFKEIVRSYKILLLPLIFTLLTILQPITIKMLPSLMKNSSNLPAGTVIQIGDPNVSDVMSSLLGQLGSFGCLVLIIMLIPIIDGERSTGVASMVLVKPVSIARYYFSKFFSHSILIIFSVYLAVATATYYTEILFGSVNWSNALLGAAVYIPILILLLCITLFISSFTKGHLVVGGVSFVIYLILTMIPQHLGKFLKSISPNNLIEISTKILKGSESYEILRPVLGVLSISAIFLILGWIILNKQEI